MNLAQVPCFFFILIGFHGKQVLGLYFGGKGGLWSKLSKLQVSGEGNLLDFICRFLNVEVTRESLLLFEASFLSLWQQVLGFFQFKRQLAQELGCCDFFVELPGVVVIEGSSPSARQIIEFPLLFRVVILGAEG